MAMEGGSKLEEHGAELRVQDNLKLMENKKFLRCLEKFRNNKKNREHFFDADPTEIQERVRFSDTLVKINRKGKRQKRALVITNLAIYNFKPNSYSSFQRRINTAHLDKIICLQDSTEFVLCMWEYSYDYDYRFDGMLENKRDEIIAIIQDCYDVLMGKELPVVRDFDKKLMATVIKTKQAVRKRSSSATAAAESQKVRRHSQVRLRLRSHSIVPSAQMGAMLSPSVLGETISEDAEPESDDDAAAGAGDAGAASDAIVAGLASIAYNPIGGARAAGVDLGSFGAAAPLVDVLLALQQQLSDNPVLEQICDADMNSFLDAVKVWAEMMGTKEACEPCVATLGAQAHLGTTALSTNKRLLEMTCATDEELRLGRAWVTSSFWRLVQQYALGNYHQAAVKKFRGFGPAVIAAVVARSEPIFKPELYTLLQALIGVVPKPSDGPPSVECFGKKINQPQLLEVLFRTLPSAPLEVRHAAMKEFNVLFVKKIENYKILMKQRGWQTWLVPLIATIPQDKAARTEMQNEYVKFVLNLFAMVFNYEFSKGTDMDKVLNRFLDQLRLQVGWNDQVVAFARQLLTMILIKIVNGLKRWARAYARDEWDNLYKFTAVVEDFMFYRPADDIVTPTGEAMMVNVPPSLLAPDVTVKLAPLSGKRVDRSRVGLHINVATGEVEDLKLAKGVVALLRKLGVTGDDSVTDGVVNKKAVERLKHCNSVARAFKSIVEFFSSGDLGGDEASLKKLGAFLEKRQKSRGSGFLSKATSKKNIVQSLQTNMLRQQAQKKLQAQVMAVAAKARQAVVISEDTPQQQLQTARKGRRLVENDASEGGDALEGGKVEEGDSDVAGAAEAKAEEPSEEVTVAEEDRVCERCEQPILGDDGIMSLEKLWHLDCFQCEHCHTPFRDDQFYERKGKAYCKEDYLNLFARSVCAGCMQPFKKGELAMEAVERMWHTDHFKCECCDRVFDEGESFFPRDRKAYCGDCNQRLFMTCPVCSEAVSADDDGVHAIGKNWHREHFVCTHCKCHFDDGVYFTKDADDGRGELPYCEADFNDLFLPKCDACNLPVKDGLAACGASWHREHFVCTLCSEPFEDGQYFSHENKPYCARDYWETFGVACAACGEIIKDNIMNALGKSWHVEHFVCHECHKPFPDLAYYPRDGHPYCEEDTKRLFCEKCPVCDEYVMDDGVRALGRAWHSEHLKCATCGLKLSSSVHEGDDGKPYCEEHYTQLFCEKCNGCGKPLTGASVTALDAKWHEACFVCSHCSAPFGENPCFQHEGKPYCQADFLELFSRKCAKCNQGILPGESVTVFKKDWHATCLVCAECNKPFQGGNVYGIKGQPYCEEHYRAKVGCCDRCGKAFQSGYITLGGEKLHRECVCCVLCEKALFGTGAKVYTRGGLLVCDEHRQGTLTPEQVQKMAALMAEKKKKQQAAEAQQQSEQSPDAAPAPAPAPAAPAPAPAPSAAPAAAPAQPTTSAAPPAAQSATPPAPPADETQAESQGAEAAAETGGEGEAAPETDWYQYQDEEGYMYYYNATTEESTYDEPESFHAHGTFEA